MKNSVSFVEPTPHHDNYGIQFFGDEGFIEQARKLCLHEFTAPFINDPRYYEKKSWGGFQQGYDPNNWLYWEFWHDQTQEFWARVQAKIEWFKKELGC